MAVISAAQLVAHVNTLDAVLDSHARLRGVAGSRSELNWRKFERGTPDDNIDIVAQALSVRVIAGTCRPAALIKGPLPLSLSQPDLVSLALLEGGNQFGEVSLASGSITLL